MHISEKYFKISPSVFFKWHNETGWPVEFVTENVVKLFGYTKADFLDRSVRYDQVIHPDDIARVIEEVKSAGSGLEDEFVHQPYRIITRSGDVRWVEDTTKIERSPSGDVVAYHGYITDITELVYAKEELESSLKNLRKMGKESEEYRRALNMSYIISTSDLNGVITHANDNLLEITGYTRDELIGQPHSLLRHPSVPKETFADMWETIRANKCWHGVLRNRNKWGKSYYVKVTIVPILDEAGEIEQYIAVRYDMTDYIEQEKQIKKMAFQSGITGLDNLYALVRDIEKCEMPLLAMINIDDFKILNNLYGYEVGDRIIRFLAHTLQQLMQREGCRIYHIHADEFAVLNQADGYDVFEETIQTVQRSIHGNGFEINGQKIPLHVSVALSDEPKERLLVSCNMAMHYARSMHERLVRYGEAIDFSNDYHENIRWTAMLHEAINNDLVQPYFQPIYNIRSGEIQKFESLMRICQGDEVFTPNLFLEIAKKVKLYPEISMLMLEKSFEAIRRYPYAFSINLSVEDILSTRYSKRLFELLSQERRGEVILEIVESESIEKFDEVNQFIEQAKSLGCTIAIDDFGTGYSNFEYLLKLNADYLKIDGSLIKNIDIDIDAEDIVRTIVSFAKKKNISVVAEFVANENIFRKVQEIGIDYAQGYFIGKPENIEISMALDTKTLPMFSYLSL